jgi:hypothetical protein
MKPELFVFLSLVNKNLREGSLLSRQAFGVQTKYWKLLESLEPERLPDGTFRGDAQYFLEQNVQTPMAKFQSALRYYRDTLSCIPLPGESLVDSYIPRLVIAVTKRLQEKGSLPIGEVEITPDIMKLLVLITQQDMKELIVQEFELQDMPENLQDEVIATIGEMVMQGLIIRATESMNPEQLTTFEKMMTDSDDADAVMQYVESFIPDFDTAVVEEIAQVKTAMDSEE